MSNPFLSIDKDIDPQLTKAWTAIDKLSVIWKADLTDKMKRSGRLDTAIWMHYIDANYAAGEKARRQQHKNAASNSEQVLEATSQKTPTVRPLTSHHENYQS